MPLLATGPTSVISPLLSSPLSSPFRLHPPQILLLFGHGTPDFIFSLETHGIFPSTLGSSLAALQFHKSRQAGDPGCIYYKCFENANGEGASFQASF